VLEDLCPSSRLVGVSTAVEPPAVEEHAVDPVAVVLET
jgi:hypothetical protein